MILDKNRKQKRLEYRNAWYARNKERLLVRYRLQKAADPERERARRRAECIKRREKRNQYETTRRATEVNYRLTVALRTRLGRAFRRARAGQYVATIPLLGCSIADFKIYIESKFEPGMSWQNYGKKGWHLDHIVPCSLFDLTKPEHQKYCFHFSNYQPLWANLNRAKYNHLPEGFQFTIPL